MKQIVLVGASGHGKVVADIAKLNGYDKIVFLDDNDKVNSCSGYPVAGKVCEYLNYDCDFFVSIGNAGIREKLMRQLSQADKNIPVLIHPNAVIAENTKIGYGTVIMAGAVINPDTVIGIGCIVNTCASADHDCVVGDYAHISVGAHICGTVRVGKGSWIGAGATVSNNINITDDCFIGAGAVIVKNIEEQGVYIGVPAHRI